MRTRILRRASILAAPVLLAATGLIASTPAHAAPATTYSAQRIAAPTAPAATTTGFRSTKDLLNVQVPSMCGHKAGRLRNGKLNTTKPFPGLVSLDRSKSRVGAIAPGAARGAVAVFNCSKGGVGWPQHVVFYNSKRRIIGHYNTAAFNGRTRVHSTRLTRTKTTVYVQGIEYNDEPSCCGSGTGRVSFTWSKARKKMIAGKRYRYAESTKAKALVAAVNRRDRKAALRHGSPQAVRLLWDWREARGGRYSLISRCFASDTRGTRTCIAYIPNDGRWGIYLNVNHPRGSVTWRVANAQWVSSD